MIRQQAFIDKKKMLKGGLHCHTTRSDGLVTPEEVIRLHKKSGYDFLALTDHRIYNYKNFAPDVDITIIPGMEFDNLFDNDVGARFFHTVCIGKSREDGNGFEQDEVCKSGTAKSPEEFQKYLDEFHAKNNLTIYCHPEWSSTPAEYIAPLKGNFAIELWNSGCAIGREMDTDAYQWDELLGRDIRLFGVATDDGHHLKEHCNGWVMVNAENNVNDIIDALKEGKFYSTCGPEIYDFYVKDGKAYIDCSDVKKITFKSFKHWNDLFVSENGKLNHAELDLSKDIRWGVGPYKYIRASVEDANGKRAWTNPIFLD